MIHLPPQVCVQTHAPLLSRMWLVQKTQSYSLYSCLAFLVVKNDITKVNKELCVSKYRYVLSRCVGAVHVFMCVHTCCK